MDEDSDGDGIPDVVEGSADPDNDGIANFLDEDSDGDGIPDENEQLADSNDPGKASDVKQKDLPQGATIENVDGDNEDNYLDPDSDGDGFEDNVDPYPYTPTYSD